MIDEREHLEGLADRCELEMIGHAERSLKAEIGPVRTNARTAAAEMAVIATTLRERIARRWPADPELIISGEPASSMQEIAEQHRPAIQAMIREEIAREGKPAQRRQPRAPAAKPEGGE